MNKMHDIFYFTDVHGYYDLYKAAMDYCMEQDPECTIIYGGDACDRGPDGYCIMNELLDNPQVIYMKGNHEDMFVHAAWSIKNEYKDPLDDDHIFTYLNTCDIINFYNPAVSLSLYNGGFQTLYDWMMDGMPDDFVNRINNLPLTFSYGKIDFCHAGGDPKVFARVAEDEYEGEYPDKDDLEMVIWDRNWLGFGWLPNRICVFGHTPTFHLPAKYYGKDKSHCRVHPCCYVGMIDEKLTGQRYDMDVGTATNGRLYVLNILTMKTQGFMDEDFEKEIEIHKIEKI